MRSVVIGAGRMGHGIGLAYALGGHDVTLVDHDPAVLERAMRSVANAGAVLAEAGLATSEEVEAAIGRIVRSDEPISASEGADVVQEAIPEVLAAKQALFADIEAAVRPDAILATNTSSLRLADVGARMRHPERLVGVHWVAPPYLVPVVEVVRGPGTSSDVAERAAEMLVGVGRIPVPVPDVAGFVLNRLQYALHLAAVDLVDQGIATPEQIDLLVRYAMAPRQLAFGAMRLFDLIVSGRTVEAVAVYLHEETGDPRFRPSPSLGAMVESGRLGAASGEGWYRYPEADMETIEARRDRAFAAAYRALAALDTELP